MGAVNLHLHASLFWRIAAINLHLLATGISKRCYQFAVLCSNVWQMVSTNFQLVLANGYYHCAVCLLHCLCAKWRLSTYSYLQQRIGKWWLHNSDVLATLPEQMDAINWQLSAAMLSIDSYLNLVLANGYYQAAGTCSNILVNGCR